MFSRIYGWLERRVDVFAPFDDRRTPPDTLAGFTRFYLGPVKGWLALVFVTSLIVAVVEASLLLLVGRFIDLLTRSTPQTLLADHGWLIAGGALTLLVLRPLSHVVSEMLVNQVIVSSLTNRIRWQTHLYTLGHALSYFQGDFAGRLANRVTQAGPALREAATEVLDMIVFVVVYVLVALAAFTSVSPWLALPMIIWIIAYGVLMRYFVPQAQERSLAVSERRSWLIGRIVDSYTNILTVKLFARADAERSAVRDAMASHTEAYQRSMRLFTDVATILSVMNTLLLLATAGVALWLWTGEAITAGAIAAALALVLRVGEMSNWFMQVLRGLFDNVGVVQESMQTIAKPHQLVDRPGAKPLVVRRGEISFEDVSFHYGRSRGAIDRLDLVVAPGERVGLVGPSGAGKSTLISLLLRLYDVEAGRILVDGQDIAGVTQDSLRQQIAVVTQDTSLLHRSIRDNIGYGRPDAPDDEIIAAAASAEASPFIAELEDHRGRRGLDSHVGERGVKLSGGQRQRIAIARVLLKDAPILILDEATSALDSEAEAAIQRQLDRLMAGKTVIAVAHRLSTIAAMDRLIVMDRGRVVEQGTHAGLVAAGGLYARLWQRQSGGFIGESDRRPAPTPA
ncbi:ABC transporter ATP-binding protein [Chelatococcus reniformis]|uniref:ABC transporter ATP-binding protein/permease n=1 Tax=Chelatococcus reniformis TaxID=1494448 RepID=A0A916UWQ1_9HYPH|nr:ABC transporter ATP-binding protein [Chelatococcus reniformis]GGC92136.1 ABC transporter ATP-binding protein/permease [Chelatococcus reniformis]